MPAAKRPTKEELQAARDRRLSDVIAPELAVLFVGINPSLYSAATGHHFARPGNRFWPALHRGGFTPRLLHPSEDRELVEYGCGLTNVVSRATARADELEPQELVAGAEALEKKVGKFRPRWVAVVGITAYRTGFGEPKAPLGRQDRTLAGAGLWVLPNPSGLNAHYQIPDLAKLFAQLRKVAMRD